MAITLTAKNTETPTKANAKVSEYLRIALLLSSTSIYLRTGNHY